MKKIFLLMLLGVICSFSFSITPSKSIVIAAGSDSQTMRLVWKPSKINKPDSITGYWVQLYRNGKLARVPWPCAKCGSTPAQAWVAASPKDTIDSAIFYHVAPPDSGTIAEYLFIVVAQSNRPSPNRPGYSIGSKTAAFMFRRTNTAKALKVLDSIPITIQTTIPTSFGIFGDSFQIFRKIYKDTSSVSVSQTWTYLTTIFPKNASIVLPKQVRTYRYSYYLVEYLFRVPTDTFYLGTLELHNK